MFLHVKVHNIFTTDHKCCIQVIKNIHVSIYDNLHDNLF